MLCINTEGFVFAYLSTKYPPFLRISKQNTEPLQSNSHEQTDTAVPQGQERLTHKQQQAGREASWLKKVRKVKGRVQSEKMKCDKTPGGGRKFFVCSRTRKKTKRLVQRTKNGNGKDRITCVDKSTTRVWYVTYVVQGRLELE